MTDRIIFIIAAVLLSGLTFPDHTQPQFYSFPELKYFPSMPVSQENPVTKNGVELGRFLFYDPILSVDSLMSCASCHRQEKAFSDSPKRFSSARNYTETSRNTMPLFNLAWYPSYFWDGRASSIEDQVFHPIRNKNEMNLEWNIVTERLQRNKFYKNLFSKTFPEEQIDSVHVSKVIAQFLRTLISYQSKFDKVLEGKTVFTSDEYDGFVLVNDQTKGDCIHCHVTDGVALGTKLVFSNNGLDNISDPLKYPDKGRGNATGNINDYGKFIVPSFRNLAFTAPYMHDGRFTTLTEVLKFYSSGIHPSANIDSKMEFVRQGGIHLSDEEQKKIIAFLLTLSDSAFISKEEFSNPFVKKH